MKIRILIIDDDPTVLETYQKTLASHSSHWEVETHSDCVAALESIRANSPKIVISSYHLEQGDGISLLKEVEAIDSDIQRFIATTEEGKSQIESAIGSAYQFLPKPCSAETLITEIQRCLAIDNWLGNPRVKEVLSKMSEFPSLPPMYLKVVNALNSKNRSSEHIGQAISGDLAITAKVLQVVNSSFYGREDKISSITQAVGILGVESIKNLVLAIQVFGNMGRSADQKAITDELWHHSMSVAVAAKRIMAYETGDDKESEEAYTAGLLHDIGKLVLMNSVPIEFAAARKRAHESNIPLWEAENQIIGCNHAETGAYLLARWGMPAPVVEAVALHHEPVNTFGTGFSCLAAVHAANALVRERNTGDSEHPDSKPNESYISEIGKASSWEEWHEVVTGKRIEKQQKKSGLSLKTESPAKPEAEKEEAKTEIAKTIETPEPNTSETEEARSSKLVPVLIALAACVGIGFGINHFTSSDNSDTEQFEAQEVANKSEPKSGLAKILNNARETAEKGTSWSSELDEVIAANEKPTHASPEPVVAETPIAREPIQQPEKKEEILPKPKLPEQEAFFPEIALAGIFYNSKNPRASINGKIRSEGDLVAGAKIERIEQRRVILRYEGKLKAIKLN